MSSSNISSLDNWRPKAVVFDLLTALLDSWTVWNACTPTGSIADGRRWREHYLSLTFSTGSYVPYENLVRQSAVEVGLPLAVAETLLRNWKDIRPWSEVPQVLSGLRARTPGVKLGVVTNCSRELGSQAVQGLCDVVTAESTTTSRGGFAFDATITAEESGWYKPVRAAYEAILPKLGCEAGDVLFVAGSAGDVVGATEAGFKVCWHNRVGLAIKGDVMPLREGRTLDTALQGFDV